MSSDLLISTAYLPSAEYFSLIRKAGKVLIENEETYIRQTPRNRCRILASNGVITLSVPVMKTSGARTLVKDITIDYTKRWQQVHRGAIMSAYNRAPYFQYYFDKFEIKILKGYKYLIDLNDDLLYTCLEILTIKKEIGHTSQYYKSKQDVDDYRFRTRHINLPLSTIRPYIQVFNTDFTSGLSILDMIFNAGPGSVELI
jgi:hypothetical protein